MLNLQYPNGTYSISNPPSNETLKGDLADIQTAVNANETALSAHEDDTSTHGVTEIVGKEEVQTLTNKTLTSPKLNEDVAVTLTATEANLLHGKLGAWTSWTPSWTNLTVGNGSVDAKYAVIGKTILFRLSLTFGSTTSITGSSVTFTLPSTIKGIAATNNVLVDASGGIYMASYSASGSSVEVVCSNVSSTYLQVTAISSTIPFTFAATDSIIVNGFYEAE